MFQNKSEKEEKFRGLFEAIADSIFIADPKSRKLIDCNKRAEKLTGYSRKEILSMRADKLHPKDLVKRTMDDFKKHAAGKILVVETEVLTKGRKRIPVSINSAIVEVDGKPCVLGIFRDMSARKEAEEALRRVHDSTKTILEKAPFGVVVVSRDRKIKWVNDTALKMTGVKNACIMLGKNCGEYMCPAQQKECPILDKGQRVDNSERILHRKDGKEIPIIKTVTEINMDGEDVLLETFVDITERKKAEEKIKESEKKYRLLAENSIDCVWMLDTKLRFTYLSPSVEKLMGVKPKQWVGTKLSSHFRKKEFLKASALAVKAITHYKTVTHVIFETKMLNNKNEEVNIEVSNKALFNSQSKLIGLQGTARDITERKQAEEALRQSEKSYQDLFNNATDAIYIQDKECRFLKVNQGAVNMYGYPNEFFIGKTPGFLSAPGKNDMKKIMGFVEDAFNGKPRQYEFWGLRKNGEVFPKIVRSQKGLFQGQDVIITFATDITERKKSEEKINEKVEELEKFYKMAIGRELRMIELKKEIEKLKEKLEKVK